MYFNIKLALPILSVAIILYHAPSTCSAAVAHGNRHHHEPHQHGKHDQQHTSQTPDEQRVDEDEHMHRFGHPISQHFRENLRQEHHVQHNHQVHRPISQHFHENPHQEQQVQNKYHPSHPPRYETPQLARAHAQQDMHRRHYHHYQQHRNLMQQHIHRAHHKYHAETRSATSATPSSSPTTRLYVAGYVVSSTKIVIIPVVESKEDRAAMENGKVLEAVLLLFAERNKSNAGVRSPKDKMQSGVEKWRVERGENMMFKSWLLACFVPFGVFWLFV